jgi:hypothetical protein
LEIVDLPEEVNMESVTNPKASGKIFKISAEGA